MVTMQDYIAVGISLPKEILARIDTERGDVSRSRFLLRKLEKTFNVATSGVNACHNMT
jgi:metal-responsive CopG/Arc/MetJ family transcriptional regulator